MVFQRLDREELDRILTLQLQEVQRRVGLRGEPIELEYSDRLCDRILDEGSDPENGARPLKRVLEQRLVFPPARLLASGQLEGGERVAVDWPEDAEEVQWELASPRPLAASAV